MYRSIFSIGLDQQNKHWLRCYSHRMARDSNKCLYLDVHYKRDEHKLLIMEAACTWWVTWIYKFWNNNTKIISVILHLTSKVVRFKHPQIISRTYSLVSPSQQSCSRLTTYGTKWCRAEWRRDPARLVTGCGGYWRWGVRREWGHHSQAVCVCGG